MFAACQPSESTGSTGSNDSKPGSAPASPDTYFHIAVGGEELMLQLALTAAEQQQGLMFRDELPTDHGMLFLFERPERRGFWMRNTGIPLDIGYFDAKGRLREVHKLFPYDENAVKSASREILIAIETNRGWFQANGVAPGAVIDTDALREALHRRGQTHPMLNE